MTPATTSSTMPAVLAMSGRGDLPHALLHKAPLYLHALKALAASGVREVVLVVDEDDSARVAREVGHVVVTADVLSARDWWDRLRSAAPAAGLLVHDPLCPLTSADFIREVRGQATETPAASLLAFRPVTDTVKTVVDSRIQGTIDREGLAALVSPAVLARDVLAAALADDERPPLEDFSRLAGWLRARGEVRLVRAPSLARRVDDTSSVNLLECVDELSRRVRREPGAATAAGVTDATARGTR